MGAAIYRWKTVFEGGTENVFGYQEGGEWREPGEGKQCVQGRGGGERRVYLSKVAEHKIKRVFKQLTANGSLDFSSTHKQNTFYMTA